MFPKDFKNSRWLNADFIQILQVNTESGDIVPFNQFYIPEIQQTIDIRADYFNWIQSQVIRTTIPARSYFERALVLLDDNVRK